jgi:hypothetical protein
MFYDNRTALVFSGDFLMPGRLLVDDAAAFHQRAMRLIDFSGCSSSLAYPGRAR